MIRVISQIICDNCNAALTVSGAKADIKTVKLLALEQKWQIAKADTRCPACQRLPQRNTGDVFSLSVANTHDKRSKYWGFNAWAKQIDGIDLSQKGGYAFKGDKWLTAKFTHEETAEKYFYGQYADFTMIACGYDSGSHAACWIVEAVRGQSDVNLVEFGRGEQIHSITLTVNGGRVAYVATSQKPKALVKRAMEMGATAEMLPKVGNPNYFAAMLLHFKQDEWKYKDNPYAIVIEEAPQKPIFRP